MEAQKRRYSSSLIRQGKFRFFTLTMPSDVLANCSFVSTRDEDAKAGFQRLLDKNRAKEIAEYIDHGRGSVPSSIVLSAQPIAKFKETGKGKTIEFEMNPKALLILDGQHRVYGFSIAKSSVRVPVVIYNGLTRAEESRLFIDINTKQRPVPNELLLDIKRLAEYETNDEAYLNDVFNLFNNDADSPLIGLLSASKKVTGKINRVSFYAAMRPIIGSFSDKNPQEAYGVIAHYISTFLIGLGSLKCADRITNPNVLRATLAFFPEVAQRVQDKFNTYSSDAFLEILTPFFSKISSTKINKSGYSYKDLYDYFSINFRTSFKL